MLKGEFVREENYTYDNILKGSAVPITVPEWTDADDWAAVCDPAVAPAIFVGERFGIMPEIYTAGDELSPAVFMNDEHRLKVRHFPGVWVNDFRPLHRAMFNRFALPGFKISYSRSAAKPERKRRATAERMISGALHKNNV